jgi:hypothetical protein
MPPLQQGIRGCDVIVWNEQKPDFFRRPVSDLLSQLSFISACAVVLNDGDSPKVLVSEEILDSVSSHLSEQSVEMGGLLIGCVYNLDEGSNRFVIAIYDHVRSIEYDSTGVSLRMGASVWENARFKSQGGRSVIGWYHSHPNLGAFFSGTDRRTQRAFFNHPYCVGLVFDPIRNEEKWFIGAESEELGAHQIFRRQAPRLSP